MSTADAVSREAAWLATSGDSLPALLAANGGPFTVVAPYWQGAQTRTNASAVYVMRARVENQRVSNQRIRPRYVMTLEVHWPVLRISPGVSSVSAETQQDLDDAMELLRQRIAGPLGDKSHGGRFLAAGEARNLPGISVDFTDPDQTVKAAKELRASVVYFCDDFEISS